jgi:hypothetical protein
MADNFTPEFERALLDATREYRRLHPEEDDEEHDLQMTARGINHDDLVILTGTMHESYIADLQSPNEEDHWPALAAIIQISLFTGMSLQRHRQEDLERILGESR